MQLLPDIVLLNPSFLVSLEQKDLAYSTIDALSHAVEGYASKSTNAFAQTLARAAIETIFSDAKMGCIDKDVASLERLQVAGFLAGIVQSTASVGLAHALAHLFGAREHRGHAEMITAWLPEVVALNDSKTDAYAALQEKKGGFSERLKTLYVELLVDDSKLRSSLSFGGDEVPLLRKDICTRTNPFLPSEEEIAALLESDKS
jgi:alcohol dehydrogenase class IV